MNLGDLNKVWEIKSLKKAREDEARKILERVAKQVQPIMRKHKWRVKLLSEFCPKNSSLLGLNVGHGVHVKLRLRRPNRDSDFFPFDQILDTMLHELCHNVHGPHNASFYNLWDEIRKECEDLMAKGIIGTSEGFDLPGQRLGGFSLQPPLSSLRQTALAAAEKRSRLSSLLPSGPKCVGGDSSIMVALSPIQAAAMAAERRLQDDMWCGSESYEPSGEGESSSGFSEMAAGVDQSTVNSKLDNDLGAQASTAVSRKRSLNLNNTSLAVSSFVDLTTAAPLPRSAICCDSVPQKRSRAMDDRSLSQSLNGNLKSSPTDLSKDASTTGSFPNSGASHNTEVFNMWECAACTLLNPPLAPVCKLCSNQKPKDAGNKYQFWCCKFCTLENSVKIDKCSACGQWRYSRGPPVAASAPSLGT
ncbi:Ubiquitinyl hydrolase 1 [Bertholletia excelsa]